MEQVEQIEQIKCWYIQIQRAIAIFEQVLDHTQIWERAEEVAGLHGSELLENAANRCAINYVQA